MKLNALVLREADGVSDAEARALVAAKNIAEGTGSAIDAAKVFRAAQETGITLPPRSALVRDGRGLACLSPHAFRMAVNEMVPGNFAAIVGRLVDDPELQVAALKVLAEAKPDNALQAEAMVRDVLAAGHEKTTQLGLFGAETVAESLLPARAKVLDEALRRVKKDKAAFATPWCARGRARARGRQRAILGCQPGEAQR